MGYILMCYSIIVCIQDAISYGLNIQSSKITKVLTSRHAECHL